MRDIAIFGPTHKSRELGLLFSGCRPPVIITDVGSAKKQREHPPVENRVKNCFTRLRGLF